MSGSSKQLRQSGRYRALSVPDPVVVETTSVEEIKHVLGPNSNFLAPFRPMGANSSATECTSSSAGTVINVSALTQIRNIDTSANTVTVQAGVRIGHLAMMLAREGLELAGGHDHMSRTIGGAVAGGCIGPAFGDDSAFFASQVKSMRLVTPAGKAIEIRGDQKNLLHTFRLSFGMLGVIFEVTLRVRPIRVFSASHRRCSFDQFASVMEKLCNLDVGLKFYLLPFQGQVYLDIRRPVADMTAGHSIPWKVKDWGESTILPQLFKSISRIVPASEMRYQMIDGISKFTQTIVNNRFVSSGSNATALMSSMKDDCPAQKLYYSTWLFPASEFPIVVQAFRNFSIRTHTESGFRCDMPTVGFRLGKDTSALLSPCFDEPMVALRAISTQTDGWDDFAIDFSNFARHWGGVPLFNQTREIPADYPAQVFGSRFEFFRKIRRQFDPDNRMMNPFLSQYFL